MSQIIYNASMTQDQFEHLLNIPKTFEKDSPKLPVGGGKGTYALLSSESEDKFYLDIHRNGTFEISKAKIQNRTSKVLLVRIEINASPHINPDGRRIGRNHIHLYRPGEIESGSLPWAYEFDEIPSLSLPKENVDFMSAFFALCKYCNIEVSNLQGVI